MLMITHTEDTNTMSTVYTTLDYEYRHVNKGTDLVMVPRSLYGTKTAERCVQYRFTLSPPKMLIITHTQKTPILFPLFTLLWIMNTDMRMKVLIWFWCMGCITIGITTKVLIKFETSQKICVELRAKML